MTRARAVEILKSTLAYDSDFAKAKQMAIEALEQEPTAEYSSDVISRQVAIDALKEHRALYCDNTPETFSKLSSAEKSRVDELDTAIATLVNMPSAQPFTEEQIQTMQELEAAQIEKAYELGKADRPTGHWIETEHSTNENGFKKWIEIRCPFCGHEPVYENIDDMEFCPKCGADMTGGEK